MARRTSFEDFVLVAGQLPWPVGVALALLSFVALHLIAAALAMPLVSARPGDIGPVVAHTLYGTMARLLQFIFPPAFLLGACISAWRRSRGLRLLDSAGARGPAAVSTMSWAEFEQLVGTVFHKQGYAVVDNPMGGPDGGVDLVLTKGNERALVQCKHWRTRTVGPSVVRELKGVMAARGVSRGWVVTSGAFTPQAQAFAAQSGIGLMAGHELAAAARQLRNANAAPPRGTLSGTNPAVPAIQATPDCPRCGDPMVRRTARRGTHAGSDFWGCRRYPKCSGTLSIN